MEDSGAILRQISSFKDMLDQVNEEIEENIQRTREIESEIVKHSEIEKDYLMRESELTKMISVGDFELNGLIQVAAATMTSLEAMEGSVGLKKMNLDSTRKRFSDKMEKFINECGKFQIGISEEENKELALLQEKEELELEKQNLRMKINTLQNSTKEYIDEILEEIHCSISVLEAELQHGSSNFMEVLKDINDLKVLFSYVSSFEDSPK